MHLTLYEGTRKVFDRETYKANWRITLEILDIHLNVPAFNTAALVGARTVSMAHNAGIESASQQARTQFGPMDVRYESWERWWWMFNESFRLCLVKNCFIWRLHETDQFSQTSTLAFLPTLGPIGSRTQLKWKPSVCSNSEPRRQDVQRPALRRKELL